MPGAVSAMQGQRKLGSPGRLVRDLALCPLVPDRRLPAPDPAAARPALPLLPRLFGLFGRGDPPSWRMGRQLPDGVPHRPLPPRLRGWPRPGAGAFHLDAVAARGAAWRVSVSGCGAGSALEWERTSDRANEGTRARGHARAAHRSGLAFSCRTRESCKNQMLGGVLPGLARTPRAPRPLWERGWGEGAAQDVERRFQGESRPPRALHRSLPQAVLSRRGAVARSPLLRPAPSPAAAGARARR